MNTLTRTPFNGIQVALPGVLAMAAVALAACGGGGGGGGGAAKTTGRSTSPETTTDEETQTGFTVAPSTPGAPLGLPAGWAALRLPSGAKLPYPTRWRPVSGDRGSASAALFNADGTIRAYLNATPADRQEQPGTWARFRVHHNAQEGDRHVRLIARRPKMAIGPLTGTCVIDQYQTSRTSYRELACLVSGSNGRPRTVLVAAAQPWAWASEQRALEFAIDHFKL